MDRWDGVLVSGERGAPVAVDGGWESGVRASGTVAGGLAGLAAVVVFSRVVIGGRTIGGSRAAGGGFGGAAGDRGSGSVERSAGGAWRLVKAVAVRCGGVLAMRPRVWGI